ncbi:hypothetical protein M0722_13815 [Microbacterium sp. KSW4-16]|uniref:hypothetical protein n=1 Tax=Microbacterium aurugineum TaxID=2851642 RepID=UPI0020BF6B3D|nr:hypothetical protein [Microbacterium aurugineum]MCK8468272.1 hypothetical protein [Microbacterium aurugineum]
MVDTENAPDRHQERSAPLLIQQRMALQRRRNRGVYTVISSVVIGPWVVLVLVDGAGPWQLLGAAVWFAGTIAGVVIGIREVVLAVRATRAFEAEHGRDAGIQR